MLYIYCQKTFVKKNYNTHKFYNTYIIKVPDDNYIIISLRSFGPDNYLLLDMNANKILIYSPYENKGLLSRRKLTKEESFSILALFESKEYMGIPENNDVVAFDAIEIEITSIIKKIRKHIHHTMPTDKTVKDIIKIYTELNVVKN